MNRFGSNNFDNENDQFEQNQQVGRQLAENYPRPWAGNQNRQDIPDNRHSQAPNYRPDYPQDYRYENQRPYVNRNGENPVMPNAPYDTGYRHHDTSIWTERNDYKDHDYRYRSGHRNYWHEDYDDNYGNHSYPQQHQEHPDNFFSHIGEGIREGWNNMLHGPHHQEREMERRADERRRAEHDRRMRQENTRFHNSGPDHRDEDFFNPKNYRW